MGGRAPLADRTLEWTRLPDGGARWPILLPAPSPGGELEPHVLGVTLRRVPAVGGRGRPTDPAVSYFRCGSTAAHARRPLFYYRSFTISWYKTLPKYTRAVVLYRITCRNAPLCRSSVLLLIYLPIYYYLCVKLSVMYYYLFISIVRNYFRIES